MEKEKKLGEIIDMIQLKLVKNIYDPIRSMVYVKGLKFLELDANERRILSTIRYMGELTMKEIMTYLPGVPYITTSAIVNKLIKLDYLNKYKKIDSKRNNYFSVTDIGDKIIQQYDDIALDCSRILYKRYLTEEEVEKFYNLSADYLTFIEKLENNLLI